MNKFLDYLTEEPGLKELDGWSQEFWRVKPKNIKLKFAQQGYEDKGHGHIKQIIANVIDLMEKYFEVFYQFNEKMEKKYLANVFKPNLILFYVAAHLHDIGMGFPGIFKALSVYVKEKGQNPLHIGEIIHNYHQYASFIILLEISSSELIDEKIIEGPYLKNLSENGKMSKEAEISIGLLKDLNWWLSILSADSGTWAGKRKHARCYAD